MPYNQTIPTTCRDCGRKVKVEVARKKWTQCIICRDKEQRKAVVEWRRKAISRGKLKSHMPEEEVKPVEATEEVVEESVDSTDEAVEGEE